MYNILNKSSPLIIPFLSVSTSDKTSLIMLCSPQANANLTVVGCVYLNLNLVLQYFYGDGTVTEF